ncbi:MAG: O-antigen ligase family protein [Acidobacteriota bacterium]|nr:O-antigen ligase family protein [Acidobacteriota bacterium]
MALAWSLFAFGAVYPWAALPLLVLALAAAGLARARPSLTTLADAGAIAALAVIALQLLPLPPSILDALSPAARAFRSDMVLAAPGTGWRPLSLDPARTRVSFMLFAAAFALMLAVRENASSSNRSLARWITWMALAAAVIGTGGATLSPHGRIYGFWSPSEPGAAPFGPIINRNHYAAWALTAASIGAGYFAANALRRRDEAPEARRLVAMLSDTRALWLLFAIAIVTVSVVLTASRGAFIGLVAAAGAAFALTWRRVNARALMAAGVACAVCVLAAVSLAQPDRLATRIGQPGDGGDLGMRRHIWRESAAVARQYPLAGVGAGAFPSAMTYYQTGARDIFFNHAHNQYLELFVEGGMLLALPLMLTAAGIATRFRRAMTADGLSSFMWLRVGAAAGLAGLAVCAIWESPFRTPATLMLAAVAAGLATSKGRH